MATSKALQFVVDLSLKDVIPEGDSEIVINALNADSYSLASFGLFSQDVKCFAILFHCIRFSHVRREGNSVAHNLVRHARHVTGFQVWMEDVPSHSVDIRQICLLFNKVHSLDSQPKKKKKKKKRKKVISQIMSVCSPTHIL